MNEASITQIGKIKQTFTSELADDARTISGLFYFIQKNDDLKNAFVTKDRKNLYKLASPVLEQILQHYRVTHFYFHDTNATNFLRVHNRYKHRDEISRHTMTQAKALDKEVHGIELGTFGTFTLRVVRPWIVDDEIIGYIELGINIEHITPALKKSLAPTSHLSSTRIL